MGQGTKHNNNNVFVKSGNMCRICVFRESKCFDEISVKLNRKQLSLTRKISKQKIQIQILFGRYNL